jgi:hypothetical protein
MFPLMGAIQLLEGTKRLSNTPGGPPTLEYKLKPRLPAPRHSHLPLGLLYCQTPLFTATVVLVMGRNRHELFAALTVYCAVLATFVGNTGQPQSCVK